MPDQDPPSFDPTPSESRIEQLKRYKKPLIFIVLAFLISIAILIFAIGKDAEDGNLPNTQTQETQPQDKNKIGGPIELAEVFSATTAYKDPNNKSSVIQRVKALRPEVGGPTVLPVYKRQGSWLYVDLFNTTPNEKVISGWIQDDGVRTRESQWRVVVDRKELIARVIRNNKQVKRFPVGIGSPTTPTPKGQFFIGEIVQQADESPLYPWVLTLNIYGVLDGVPAPVALHGSSKLGGIGQAVSNGCVRFYDVDINWLALHVDPGTVVDVI